MSSVREHLELMCSIMPPGQKKKCPWPYSSQYDFVLKNGRDFTEQDLPKKYGKFPAQPQACFLNSAKLAIRSGLTGEAAQAPAGVQLLANRLLAGGVAATVRRTPRIRMAVRRI